MDALLSAVEAAIPKVDWFALGDAKRIAREMRAVVRSYKKNPDVAQQKKLRDIAKEAHDYLRQRSTEDHKDAINALGRGLSASK